MNIKGIINRVNALGEKQVFSRKKRKVIILGAYSLSMCLMSMISVNVINTYASHESINTYVEKSVEAISEKISNISQSSKKELSLKVEVTNNNTQGEVLKKIPTENADIKKDTSEIVEKIKIISDEAKLLARAQIISGEVIIDEKDESEESLELTSAREYIDLENNNSITFMSVGQGTLVTGILEVNSIATITTSEGKECRAQTNKEGKFGCMFADESLTLEDITASY